MVSCPLCSERTTLLLQYLAVVFAKLGRSALSHYHTIPSRNIVATVNLNVRLDLKTIALRE